MIEPRVSVSNKRFAIVASRWNPEYTEKLLQGAVSALAEHGVAGADLTVVRVPGAFEIPFACKKLALTGNYAAIITVGTLIKGETSHYKLICNAVANGISAVGLETGVPVTFGVITAKDEEQAADRAGGRLGNVGREAAIAAIELCTALSEIR